MSCDGDVAFVRLTSFSHSVDMPVSSRLSYGSSSYSFSPRCSYRGSSVDRGSSSYLPLSSVPSGRYTSLSGRRPPLPSPSPRYPASQLSEARKYLIERRAADNHPSSPRYTRSQSRELTNGAADSAQLLLDKIERVSERIRSFESRSAASPVGSRRGSRLNGESERLVPILLQGSETTERRPSVTELRSRFDSVALSSEARPSVCEDDPVEDRVVGGRAARERERLAQTLPSPPAAGPEPVTNGPQQKPAGTPEKWEHYLTLPRSRAPALVRRISEDHNSAVGTHLLQHHTQTEPESPAVGRRSAALLSESSPAGRRQRTDSSGSQSGSGPIQSSSCSPAASPGSSDRSRLGLTGLRNIGNTCFMNSVLQCVSNTRALHDYILRQEYTADINASTSSMKGALIQVFASLFGDLWRRGEEGERVLTTAPFKAQIQRFAPRFMGYQQQDAQEFLRYLLEGLHEDVNRVTSRPKPISTDIDDSLSDNQKAMESWKRFMRFDNSKFVDLFVGQLKSTLRCTVCGHASVTFDPFWDLSLPIPSKSGQQVRLQACFELFTKEETLDGDEKPTCAKCQKRQKCTKSFSIHKFPRILVVHLKRFSPAERYRGKLNSAVDFPLCGLDLSAYSTGQGPCRYNLYGVANHSGTLYSGHYTAHCRHPYSGEWHEYNDTRVRPVSQRSVVSNEAYVLFFELAGAGSSHL